MFVVAPGRGHAFDYNVNESDDCRSTVGRHTGNYDTFALIQNKVQRFAPDLAIAGYESALPRIARLLSIKCIRIDYQHLLDDLDPASLPLPLRLRLITKRFTDRLLSAPVTAQIVSAFHKYPVRGDLAASQIQHVGVLLRKELQGSKRCDQHLLIKARASFRKECLDALLESKLPARVYGFDRTGTLGNILFRSSSETFAEDLLSCVGVITNTSNQLIGEALGCGKPVLAIPGTDDYHQQICALFLASQSNNTLCKDRLCAKSLRNFYEQHYAGESSQCNDNLTGNAEVKAFIERCLPN